MGLSLICLFTLSPRVDLMLFGCTIIHGFSERVKVGFLVQMPCRKPPVLRGCVSAVDLSLHDQFTMAQAQSRFDWLGFILAQKLKIGSF